MPELECGKSPLNIVAIGLCEGGGSGKIGGDEGFSDGFSVSSALNGICMPVRCPEQAFCLGAVMSVGMSGLSIAQ